MARADVIAANEALAAEDEGALAKSKAAVAELAQTHVKQRTQLEDYHVGMRQDDGTRRWEERQKRHDLFLTGKSSELEKETNTEKAQRVREAAEEQGLQERAEKEVLARDVKRDENNSLREWTTEFRGSPLATRSPVAPECSVDMNMVERFPTSPVLTKSVVQAVGRATLDVSQLQAQRLVVGGLSPQRQADDDELQLMEKRIEMEMERVSALNIFHAQEAREQRLAAAKAQSHREIGVERARATKHAEEMEASLKEHIHKIQGRQLEAQTLLDAAVGGRGPRKMRALLTRKEQREVADRLSEPKEVHASEA